MHFQRAYDNNKEFKTRELRLVEWTKNYVPLQESNDSISHHYMVGGSGSKLYLHNLNDEVSYILEDNLVWNLKTDLVVIELNDQKYPYCESLNVKQKFKIIYSIFDMDTFEDVIYSSVLDLDIL